jgi:PAS domain S-box-containing protein
MTHNTSSNSKMYLIKLVSIVAVYFITAWYGLKLNAVSGFATLVWPPTGIALAALIVFGTKFWPAVFMGALLVNFIKGAPLPIAIGMGFGNTLEAIFGAYLLRKVEFRHDLERIRDVAALVILAALTSTLVSAGIGVTSLWFGNVVATSEMLNTFKVWWLGDSLGDLIIAPLLFCWAGLKRNSSLQIKNELNVVEVFFFALFSIAAVTYVFGRLGEPLAGAHPISYIVFPLVIYAAIRFNQIGTVTTTFIISFILIGYTAMGRGPFSGESSNVNQLVMHGYLAVVAMIGLFLAAAVAEGKNRESELGRTMALYSSILRNSLDCIIIMDAKGIIKEFNPCAEEIFGYKRDEIIGKEMAEFLIPKNLRELHRRGLAHYVQTGKGPVLNKRIEVVALHRDGHEFPVELTITPIDHDGPPMFSGSLRDITKQKKNEQQRNLQFNVMTALANATSLRDAAKKLIQIIAEDLDWELGVLWTFNETGTALKAFEVWHREGIHAPEFIRATLATQMDKGNGLPGRIWESGQPAAISDVTDDKNFPRCAIATREGLRGAIGFPIMSRSDIIGVIEFFSKNVRSIDQEMMTALAVSGGQIGQFMNRLMAEDLLREALDLRDEFLSVASHELKTPLSALNLQLQILQRNIQPKAKTAPTFEMVDNSMSSSLRQVKSLIYLVEELMDVSRIHSGKFSLNLEDVDLGSIVKEIVERLRYQLQIAKCPVKLELDSSITGLWDATRLEQIIVNLISNAIKYAPGSPIHISAHQDGEKAVLIVEDKGPGIPAEAQATIFQRFQRVQRIKNVSGLGLGLFVVKCIVEAHQGTVRLESAAGKGCKFTIEIPLKVIASEVASNNG